MAALASEPSWYVSQSHLVAWAVCSPHSGPRELGRVLPTLAFWPADWGPGSSDFSLCFS